jgi:hypothetical protein
MERVSRTCMARALGPGVRVASANGLTTSVMKLYNCLHTIHNVNKCTSYSKQWVRSTVQSRSYHFGPRRLDVIRRNACENHTYSQCFRQMTSAAVGKRLHKPHISLTSRHDTLILKVSCTWFIPLVQQSIRKCLLISAKVSQTEIPRTARMFGHIRVTQTWGTE